MSDNAHQTSSHALRLKRLGIDTYQEPPVIYMRSDCHVCRAEGFEAQSRVQVAHNGHAIIAASLLMQHSIGPRLGEMPLLAAVGYALALWFTWRLARGISRSGKL